MPLRWSRKARTTRSAASRRSSRPRLTLTVEALERRDLLSVSFTPGPYAVPANNADVGIGQVENFGRAPKAIVEPLATVNPTDPANVAYSSQNGIRVSTDGGATFGADVTFPILNTDSGSDGDTAAVFDPSGRLFWANLSNFSGNDDQVEITELNPQTGAQIGSTYVVDTPPAGMSDDKEFLTSDSNGDLYMVWSCLSDSSFASTILINRSTDHGKTWMASPVTVSTAAEGWSWPSTIAVGPNGDVFVSYHSQPGFTTTSQGGIIPDGTSGQVVVAVYNNDLSTQLSKTTAFAPGAADLTFNVQDGGRTIPGTDYWTMGAVQPWVLPDPVRTADVYVVTNTDPNPTNSGNVDHADVVYATSADNGKTWTTATLATAPAGTSNTFRLFPTAAIDPFGDIAVAWYQNYSGTTLNPTNSNGNYLLSVDATYSTDGGKTWAPVFQVNDPNNLFDPDPNAINRFDGPPPTTRIGEYFGIGLFGGTAYLAWNGNIRDNMGNPTAQQVMTSTFAVQGALTVTGDDAGPNTNDTFLMNAIPTNPAFTEILVNGKREYAGLSSAFTNAATGITLDPRGGNNTVDVQATPAGVTTAIVNSAGAVDAVVLGSQAPNLGGTLAGIQGNVMISNVAGLTRLTLDDSGDGTGRTVVLDSFPVGVQTFGRVTGLGTSASISFDVNDTGGRSEISALTILAGSGGNTFNVQGNLNYAAIGINTGSGNDQVNVAVTASSRYDLGVDGGPGFDVLAVTDVQGGGVIHDHKTGPTSGTVQVCYLGGATSLVGYQDVEQVNTSETAGQAYIQALYHQFLGRNATPQEVAAWQAALAGPNGQFVVANGIIRSREAYTVLVRSWYVRYLGRAAQNGEEQGWVNALLQGLTQEVVLSTFLNSLEYYQKAGGTDDGFIRKLFLDLLGRPAGGNEVSLWEQSLRAVGRGGVAWLVLESQEYRDKYVTNLYQTLLMRSPSAAEVAAWALSPFDLTSLEVLIASSQEFFNNGC